MHDPWWTLDPPVFRQHATFRVSLRTIHSMLLTTPTFNIEILPNALAALPELFTGLDSILPALDIQLEEAWSGESGAATEVLITANVEQALLDSRAVFLVNPNPDAAQLANLLDTGRQVRWVSEGTPQSDWVDSFARFLFTLRISEKAQATRNLMHASRSKTKAIPSPKGKRKKAS